MTEPIDIRRNVEVEATCSVCTTTRLLPTNWREILAQCAPPDWDGVLRCRNGHESAEMWTQVRITCPVCGRRSYNPNDVRELYCGYCHWWTSDPLLGPRMPDG